MKLAINGGEKIRKDYFPAYKVIGKEEEEAVLSVVRSGILSKYLGAWSKDFYGGPKVREVEEKWAKYFNVKHAISVNSATSGLYCAVGAIGVGTGDEVLVPPYTMSASATGPLVYNAVPVFCDIEEDCFCISKEAIESKITSKTKAIIAVDIFGQPYNARVINEIAKKYNLYVIEDAAQAPGAKLGNDFAGCLGDIGVFSLNYHKHIHCGEGGIVVTNDDELAERVRLIRNHAEAVVENKGVTNLNNMLGFNLRMTELEASIASCQIDKLDNLIEERINNVKYLETLLKGLPCITLPKVRDDAKHVYYVHTLKYIKDELNIHRNKFVEAVKAELMPTLLREDEGVCIGAGYVKPLYLQPLYQNKILYGNTSMPFSDSVDYSRGLCEITERMHFDEVITHELMRPGMTKKDLQDVADAFIKVYENREELCMK